MKSANGEASHMYSDHLNIDQNPQNLDATSEEESKPSCTDNESNDLFFEHPVGDDGGP